jgi:hypothetical protein
MTSLDWKTNPDGTVKVYPLTGWDSFLPFGMACGLRLHYAESEKKLVAQDFDYLPLILTPAQARELSGVLSKLADKAESAASPDETKQ